MIGSFFEGLGNAAVGLATQAADRFTGGGFSMATDALGINTGTGGGPFNAEALSEVAGLTSEERLAHSATTHEDTMTYKDQELKQETESSLFDMGAKETMGTLDIMDGNIDNSFEKMESFTESIRG